MNIKHKNNHVIVFKHKYLARFNKVYTIKNDATIQIGNIYEAVPCPVFTNIKKS